MMKALKKLETEEMYLNILRLYTTKSIINTKPNGEKFKAFPLKLGTRVSTSPLLFNIITKVLI